ncbi:GAF domain-containing protein [Streptomyces shenzhenensis]|uniref:GAF domain-containing protein n=1 Tax=Streptomyces shenzhenensis TaxID=943815 RepID=UPI0015F04411|nr:GAF domain-containing protein [Streptomyces shenzhenensis]
MMTFPYAHGTSRTTQHQVEAFTDDPATELSEMATRLTRFAELGISMEGQEVLDDISTDMAAKSGFLYGMVNAFGEEQTFLGLHNPPRDSGYPIVGRTMSRKDGWCPEVVRRRRGLPLPDVAASPRFLSNHVADAIGISSYFGEPIIDEVTGLALLTVCIIDPEPRTLADAARVQAIVRKTTREAANVLKIRMPPAP